MELEQIPTRIALAQPSGWEMHDAKLTGLDDQGATAEVHFDLPGQCADRAVLLQVELHGESTLALCEHRPPERSEPGLLYLQFVSPDAVHTGSFGELIDVHRA
jgi:hypothetical protein